MFGATSQVEVPGDGPQFHDARPVPHGLVSALQYESRALGVPRRALVYTPPGYEAGRETYPVLVLMHGIGDTEVDWVHTGRANQILDNLIAEGTVRPMVVVMPLGHARQSVGIGPVPNARAGEPLRGDPFAHAAIERDLLDDLLPAVERRFRVARDADRRAIAGLSLGGTQGLRIGLRHLDRFGWIATLSAALVDADPAVVHAGVLADTAATHRRLRLLYVTVGRDDPLLAANQRFADALRRAGVRHTFRIEEGRHEWRLWRRNLRDVLPLLFRD
jgi:enterochelin esterase family protein